MSRLRVHLETSIMVGLGTRCNGRLSIKIGLEGKQAFNYPTTSYHKAKVACDPVSEKKNRRMEKLTLVIGRKITQIKENLSNSQSRSVLHHYMLLSSIPASVSQQLEKIPSEFL